jgi:hypothetical protein
MTHLKQVVGGETTFADAIQAYDAEVVPRGRDEVSCSVENGFMLHDWDKVKASPVFRNGFKPMTGHDGLEKLVSEHAEYQKRREEQDRGVGVTVH